MPSELRGDGWDLLTDAVQRQIQAERSNAFTERMGARFSMPMRPLVMQAARTRGVSTDTYIRRAVAAFLVYDLGLDWYELLADEPWATLVGQDLSERRPLAGAGYGPWHIDSMSEAP